MKCIKLQGCIYPVICTLTETVLDVLSLINNARFSHLLFECSEEIHGQAAASCAAP